MGTDFTCRVTAASDQGQLHFETLSCTESTGTDTPRVVDVVSVSFPPEKLNVVDINAKRRFWAEKYQDDGSKIAAELKGPFKNPAGGRATDFLAMPDFAEAAVVTGGIYFADAAHDRSWPQTGETTKQADGFVWYKPDPKREGQCLSEPHGKFTSGGYLFVDSHGKSTLARVSSQPTPPTELDDYRLVVQSNIILVANGSEDANQNKSRHALAALSAQKDGALRLVVAAEPGKPSNGFGLTHQEFGDLLASQGSLHAINLDGGPSAQFAVRKDSVTEDLIHHTDPKNPMPQVFSVSR